MFSVNQVIAPVESEPNCPIDEAQVLIFIDESTDRLFTINLTGTLRKPQFLPYRHVATWCESDLIHLCDIELPRHMIQPDSQISTASILKRDRRWEAIAPITARLEEFLLGAYGDGIVSTRARELGKTRQEIYTWVYCQRQTSLTAFHQHRLSDFHPFTVSGFCSFESSMPSCG